ncbi:hypothetical protein CBL_01871 [Carabus blaptoides fortunei]
MKPEEQEHNECVCSNRIGENTTPLLHSHVAHGRLFVAKRAMNSVRNSAAIMNETAYIQGAPHRTWPASTTGDRDRTLAHNTQLPPILKCNGESSALHTSPRTTAPCEPASVTAAVIATSQPKLMNEFAHRQTTLGNHRRQSETIINSIRDAMACLYHSYSVSIHFMRSESYNTV